MSNRLISVFLLTLLFAFSSQIFAQTLKIPFRDVGACPFECCMYREWTVNKDTKLLKQMSDNSAVAFKVTKGEKVNGLTGVVITTKPGIGKAIRDTYLEGYLKNVEKEKKMRIRKGQTFSLLTYEGEDVYLISYKGVLFTVSMYNDNLLKVNSPKSIWWVKIKNKKGQVGWTKLPENFDDMDACG
jgi:hypothetical protein